MFIVTHTNSFINDLKQIISKPQVSEVSFFRFDLFINLKLWNYRLTWLGEQPSSTLQKTTYNHNIQKHKTNQIVRPLRLLRSNFQITWTAKHHIVQDSTSKVNIDLNIDIDMPKIRY